MPATLNFTSMPAMVAPRPRGPTVQRPAAVGASIVLTLMVVVISLERPPGPVGVVADIILIGLALASGWLPVRAGVAIGVVLTALLAFPADDTFAVFACLVPIVVLGVIGRHRTKALLSLWYVAALGTMILIRGDGETTDGTLGAILFVLVLVGGAWLLGSALHGLERQREEVRRSAVRRLQLSVARDLHDTVAHSLSLIALRADRAQSTHRPDDDLRAIGDESRQAIQDLRGMLTMLRRDIGVENEDAVLHDGGSWTIDPLLTILERDLATLRAVGFDVAATTEGDVGSLTRTADRTLAKVLHESLSNVHRHAEPRTQCTVIITVSARVVELAVVSVARSGEGSPTQSGLGLIGMRERVEALGVELQAGRMGNRWVVQVSLPHAVNRALALEEER
jgi:signal transduction histidine kinase